MPDLKLLRIEEGDNQKVLADKVNSNFSDILTFGGGPYGKIGQQGPEGNSGQTGPVGSYGDMGSRGSIWTIGATDPGLTGYLNNDFWLNTRTGLGNQIYQFSSSGWSQYGFGILSQDIFRVYPNIPTSAGNSAYNGYTLTSTNPSSYTLVLSDNQLSAGSITNPQYSKVVIAIDGGATGKNLMEFTKGSYSANTAFNTRTPRFYWTSTATTAALKYGLSWKNGDSLFFDIPFGQLKLSTTTNGGSNSRYRSTGFNLNLAGNQGLSVTTSGKFILNFSPAGTSLLSNRNISYAINTYSGNLFVMPIAFDFTNTLNGALPPLWLESTKSGVGNLRFKANVTSSRVSRLFLAYTSSEIIFDVKANGEVWYNKRINSIQPAQTVTPTVTGNTNIYGPAVSVQWYTVIPGAIYSGAGGTASQRISANNGTDFVISPSVHGPSNNVGICLWTPATGGTVDNNGGWLNMLNDHEAINFRVRTDSESKYIRFLGLNSSNTFTDAPYAPLTSFQAIDLTGATGAGVSHVDFTIMNIYQSYAYTASARWFKIYYSAYGGNIVGSKCGFMYATSMIYAL
jgi:hypothetical protein